MYYSIHVPSPFICNHCDQLLPAWSQSPQSVLVALQPCDRQLLEKTPESDQYKQLLRQQFLEFADQITAQLQREGHLAEVFDPRTGLPLLSPPGSLHLDDVAVACACLGYPRVLHKGCSVLVHPLWGSSVYPSTVLTSAPPPLLQRVMVELDGRGQPVIG